MGILGNLEVKSQVTRCDTYEHLWETKAYDDWLVCPRITGQSGERGCARRWEFPAPAPTGGLRASTVGLEGELDLLQAWGWNHRESNSSSFCAWLHCMRKQAEPSPHGVSEAVEREPTRKEGGSVNAGWWWKDPDEDGDVEPLSSDKASSPHTLPVPVTNHILYTYEWKRQYVCFLKAWLKSGIHHFHFPVWLQRLQQMHLYPWKSTPGAIPHL